MRRSSPNPNIRGRAGLTLTEVLVAMVLAAVVVLGSWSFFGNASVSMQVFNGLAITDERLAFAADLLTTDARRAGMFGTPHSEFDPMVCPKPIVPYRAVIIRDGDSLPAYAWGNNANIDPDVCIFQEPITSRIFHPVSINGTAIFLSATEEGVPTVDDEFDRLYQNRLLRIVAPNGFSQFVTVTGTNFNLRRLTVTPAPTLLEDNGLCGIEGIGGPDHEVTVLSYVRYRIIPDPNDDDGTLLVREELTPDLATVLGGTRLVVAENVVDLQCWGDEDQGVAADPDFAEDTALGDDTGTGDASATSTETQRMRVFHYQISARTDREFPSYALDAKDDAFDLLTTWDIDGDPESAALALTVGQQVELSNFVVRRLR